MHKNVYSLFMFLVLANVMTSFVISGVHTSSCNEVNCMDLDPDGDEKPTGTSSESTGSGSTGSGSTGSGSNS
jgi:hypothetical protein